MPPCKRPWIAQYWRFHCEPKTTTVSAKLNWMAYSKLPSRQFLGHQAWGWTTLRRGNVFYYVYKRFFMLVTFLRFLTFFLIFIWTFFLHLCRIVCGLRQYPTWWAEVLLDDYCNALGAKSVYSRMLARRGGGWRHAKLRSSNERYLYTSIALCDRPYATNQIGVARRVI